MSCLQGAALDNGRIGNRNHDSAGENSFFSGAMDDFRYYDRALSGQEVFEIYNNGVGSELADPASAHSTNPGTVYISHVSYTPQGQIAGIEYPIKQCRFPHPSGVH